MWKVFCFACSLFFALHTFAQHPPVSRDEVSRILGFLASDNMKGRGNHTPELYKAAMFIAREFEKDSLLFVPGHHSYFHPFTLKKEVSPEWIDSAGNYDHKNVLLNVAGLLPGRSRKNEVIIFSAHYDHVGVERKKRGDSIYNGANDNASGTTAVIALAHYFARRRDNERTLLFCTFSGEELGLFGSLSFANMLNPAAITAVINIEMIGATNAAGNNAFFITGEEHSDLDDIFKKQLKETRVRLVREPADNNNLFGRSDNYPFALKQIPAHTIMSSDDQDPCYHRPCDDMNNIDLANMTRLINAIAVACRTLIDGTDTPQRLSKPDQKF